MDKELAEIGNKLDSITNSLYGLNRIGELVDAAKEIGNIGLKDGQWSNSSNGNQGATLADIKQALDDINTSLGGVSSGSTSSAPYNQQLADIASAIESNTSQVKDLVQAVRTMAEVQLQQLTHQENTAAAHAVLPWSDEEPNLDYGWVEDLEQATGEKDLEDASL